MEQSDINAKFEALIPHSISNSRVVFNIASSSRSRDLVLTKEEYKTLLAYAEDPDIWVPSQSYSLGTRIHYLRSKYLNLVVSHKPASKGRKYV